MNYAASSHPPPVDDDSKPFKKRKKLNPVTSGAAATSREPPAVAMPMPPQPKAHPHHRPGEQQKSHAPLQQPPQPQPQPPAQRSQQPHKYLSPSAAVNNASHVLPPPPPLEVQHRPPIEELSMKKNLSKSPAGSTASPAQVKPQKPTRRRWTPAEDESLKKLVVSYGNSWASIAQHMPSRSQRTCRARWHYVLDPNIKRTQWTEEEEDIIVTFHNKFGNKWSKIAKHLEGRSAEAIRNHWNCRRNSLTARWKGRQAKDAAAAKPETSTNAAWEQPPPSVAPALPPPPPPAALAPAPYYTSKPTDNEAGAEAAAKTVKTESTAKIAEETPATTKATAPSQPPALYPANESSTDRSNWSRVSRGQRVFSADACADIGAMPASVGSNSACVESQSLILPFSYKPSGASL